MAEPRPTEAIEQRGPGRLPPGTAICIGAFDGLHLGHQALIDRARAQADRVALVTFDPHPMRVLAPDRAPALLQTPEQRRRVAGHYGVERVVLLPFDAGMAAMSAEDFVRDVLVDGLGPAAVIVGQDFRFGHGRAGNTQMLAELLNVPLEVVAPVGMPEGSRGPDDDPDRKLGSTAVRRAVAAGDMERVTAMLGRPFSAAGTVVHGDRRGRTIGFPTANVAVRNEVMPPTGVYATVLTVWSPDSPDHGAVWASVTNLGTSPTFKDGDAPIRLEAHALDRDLEERLYDFDVEVAFVQRLRGEVKFDGVDPLVAQMRLDADAARQRLDGTALAGVVAPKLSSASGGEEA